ncbi:MAG: hypothetical protein GC154_11660 [bacterium]|nr:hypothetical protein [bacterium]
MNRQGWLISIALLALTAGVAIAWLDTRPNWDDAGVTAGMLVIASAIAGALGAPWWLAAGLVAAPMIAVEIPGAGPGILIVAVFAVIGALIGAWVGGLARITPQNS